MARNMFCTYRWDFENEVGDEEGEHHDRILTRGQIEVIFHATSLCIARRALAKTSGWPLGT